MPFEIKTQRKEKNEERGAGGRIMARGITYLKGSTEEKGKTRKGRPR